MLKLLDVTKRLEHKCHKFADSKKCPNELKSYYFKELPSASSLLKDLEVISLDFETTGINPKEDYILSMGGISIVKGVIDFQTSFHYYVNNSKYIKKDSAVINQITPEQLQQGKDPKVAIKDLLDKISGKVVLVHCQFIETNFIKQALNLKPRDPLPFIVLDTMNIERKLTEHTSGKQDLRLSAIRQKRGLPEYDAHNALVDSLATAEVFLSQLKDVYGNKPKYLSRVYKRSH